MAGRVEISFGVGDYIVFVLILLAPLGMGLYSRLTAGRKKNTSEYLVGSRKMKVIPVAISLAVSFLSGITILGHTAEVYFHDLTFSVTYLGSLIGMVISIITVLPVFYPLKLTSVNEYLMLRYKSEVILKFAWCVTFMFSLCFNGIVLYAPATMMETTMHVPTTVSMVVIAICGTLYTSVGGFRTVIWADVFQAAVIIIGVLVILIRGSILSGGFGNIWHIYAAANKSNVNFNPSPYKRQNFWSIMLGNSLGWLGVYGCAQAAVQRICSMPTYENAKRMVILAGPTQCLTGILCVFCGIIMFGYYGIKGCDPYTAGYIRNTNQIMPYFSMEVLAFPGAMGLFLSSLVCGSLSNLSSTLSGLTALTWMDIFSKRLKGMSESRKTLCNKMITVVIGGLSLCVGLLVSQMGGTFVQIAISIGSGITPMSLTLYLLGCLVPRVNWKSVLTGAMTGMVLTLSISMSSLYHKAHQQVAPGPIHSCSFSYASNATADWYYVNSTQAPYMSTSPPNGSLAIAPTTSHMDDMVTHEDSWKPMAWIYEISFYYFTTIGCTCSFLVAIATSYLIPGFSEENNDLRTLNPYVRRFARGSGGKKAYSMVAMDNENDENGDIVKENI